jgi:hypothetical protein
MGEAMKCEGPTITGCGGELIVLLFTTGAFVDDSGDGTEGGDKFDVGWPVDGLYCATAIPIQSVIAAILIAIIEHVKTMPIAFWLIKIIYTTALICFIDLNNL